jgi:hypothetical protein
MEVDAVNDLPYRLPIRNCPACHLSSLYTSQGVTRDVVCLGWSLPSYMSPNAGSSANEYSCAYGAQINFGDLTPYLTYNTSVPLIDWCIVYTDKKKKIKFSSYIRKFRRERLHSHIWLRASSNMTKYLCISLYIRKPFLLYDFSTASVWISLYMRKITFSFISGYRRR